MKGSGSYGHSQFDPRSQVPLNLNIMAIKSKYNLTLMGANWAAKTASHDTIRMLKRH